MDNKLKFYVYAHYRKTDGKLFYIGKGCGNRVYTKTRRNPIWTNIFKKHGFYFEILERFENEDDALKKEEELISFYRNSGIKLANVLDGGKSNAGHRHSEETRLKMSISRKGKTHKKGWKHNEETKKRMSESHKGQKLSNQHVAALKKSLTGKRKTDIHKLNLSISRTGIKVPAIWKQIMCIDTNEYYESISDAAEKTGLDISHIVKCCKGKLPHIKGYSFIYV